MLPRAVVFIALALAVPLAFAGCGSSGFGLSDPSGGGTPTTIRAYMPDASDAATVDETPHESAAAQPFKGNALCASLVTGCYPDNMVNACTLAVDGGAPDAESDAASEGAPACHVVSEDSGVRTACLPTQVGGMAGSTCSTATDCSPGFECVDDGTCRHYCCSGNSACSVNQFCDVRPTAQDPNTLVPVCMLELPCTLLEPGDCADTEQCSVVREDGTTSCVPVGTALDRQPCDVEHCARGFVCIGPQGARQCAPLCYTANPGVCDSGRTCTGALPLFPDSRIGACQ